MFFFSCASKEETEIIEAETPEVEVLETEDVVEDIPVVIEDEVLEDVTETDSYEDDEPAFIEQNDDDDEYYRSISDLEDLESVSREEFTDDKTAILQIIEKLSDIMETQNYNEWLKYIEPESIEYYSNPVNLRKAQKKLPNKMIQLKGMKDYFKNVFIPARQRSKVDEIRYISKTVIKAVEVKADFSTVIYYHFTKIDGKWYVRIPPVN